MLLGTHPIPARSPAEREGQNRKEMRRGTEEERRRDGECVGGEWGSVDGMIGEEDREKLGIVFFVFLEMDF